MTPAVLQRFPQLRFRKTSAPVLPPSAATQFQALAADVAIVQEELAPAFEEFDFEALREQNRFRLQRVRVLVGSALVTGLGGLQAAISDQRWPGVVLAVLAATVAALSRAGKERGTQDQYLTARLTAERLRSLHFRFLSGLPPYHGDDAARRLALQHAVADIRAGREPRAS